MLSPIIAILRGLTPEAALDIGEALLAGGIDCAEVPLNRPGALESLAVLAQAFPGRLRLGAGTVLTPDDVRSAHASGARFIVSPNTDPDVIREAKSLGLLSAPGVFTASEAFTALRAGADALKLFPADALGPGALKALKTVLPPNTRIYAVGGVELSHVDTWRRAGAGGLGLGGSLYREGSAPATVAQTARAFVSAWTAAAA